MFDISNQSILYFIIIIFCLVILLFLYYVFRTKVYFPSIEDVYHTIKYSKYIKSLSHIDFKIRNVIDKKHLLSNYKLYLHELTDNQKEILLFYCKVADDKLYKKNNNIAKLSWNIILFEELEDEMPHTHGNYILLPLSIIPKTKDIENKKFIDVLIHEKYHIYQRLNYNNPKFIKKMSDMGFDIYNDKLPNNIEIFRRKNPDFDLLYTWRKRYIPLFMLDIHSETIRDGELILYDIKENRNLTRINQSKIFKKFIDEMKNFGISKDYQMEHPYEILCYQL